MFDIHSHILPGVDDGAKDIAESIELLRQMKEQGITAVAATPHFYPQEDNLTEFSEKIISAFEEIKTAYKVNDLPEILIGSEMLYFKGISNSTSLNKLCLNKSSYLLLELVDCVISDSLFEELLRLKEELGIIPIIAHIERYQKARNYKKLLKFVKEHNILTQVNASAFLIPIYKRTIKKLLKLNLISFIASDSHSPSFRPPMVKEAYDFIEDNYGKQVKEKLIKNADKLFKEITSKEENYA